MHRKGKKNNQVRSVKNSGVILVISSEKAWLEGQLILKTRHHCQNKEFS